MKVVLAHRPVPTRRWLRHMSSFLVAVCAVVLGSSMCLAQPTTVGYQGELRKDGALFDGAAEFKFALISEGGSQTLWSNDGTSTGGSEPVAGVNVAVTDGVFAVHLGQSPMVPIDAGVVGSAIDASLRVWVDTGGGFEQLSDQPLSSAPFSLHSESADGSPGNFHASGMVQAGDSTLIMIPGGLPGPVGSPDRLITDSASSNRLCLGKTPPGLPYDISVFQNVLVGIGQLNPTERLDVNGKGMFNNPGPGNNAGTINTDRFGLHVYNPTPGRRLQLYTWGQYNDLGSFGAPLALNHTTAQDIFMCAQGGGNVGIGTIAPTQRLDVAGRARIRTLPAPGGAVEMVVADANGDLFKQPTTPFQLPFAGSGSTSSPSSCRPGVFAVNSTGSGIAGVVGCYQAGLGGVPGVLGVGVSPGTVGVKGDGNNGNGGIGVWGDVGYGIGVQGIATGSVPASVTPVGVYGQTLDPGSGTPSFNGGIGVKGEEPVSSRNNLSKAWAGYFLGDVNVTGALSVSGLKAFRIDHPLDPENKYLMHSCIESNEMMNIYKGRVTTDENGDATVRLPDYFEALNGGIEYHLTVIGQFAQAIVAEEVKNNQFAIKTDKANVAVSWQVLGVRQDAAAKANPLVVEIAK